MTRRTLLFYLLVLVAISCTKKGTEPPHQNQDVLVPVPVYYRNLNDLPMEEVPYIDSFRIYIRYIFYYCPAPNEAPLIPDTFTLLIDTVFPARVDAPNKPNAGYLEYHATTYHDSTWHYIGTIWMLYRKSFYGGHGNPWFTPQEAVWLPGASDPILQPGEWDSSRMNQGRAFVMYWTQSEPIPTSVPHVYAAPEMYQTEVLGWLHMDDGTFKEIQGPITVWVLDDPVVNDQLILRLEIGRIQEQFIWNERFNSDPVEIKFGGVYDYEE